MLTAIRGLATEYEKFSIIPMDMLDRLQEAQFSFAEHGREVKV